MDFVNTQIGRVKQLDRLSLLKGNKERTSKKGYVNRMVLTLDFHPALLDVHKILQDLQVLVNTGMSPVLA